MSLQKLSKRNLKSNTSLTYNDISKTTTTNEQTLEGLSLGSIEDPVV